MASKPTAFEIPAEMRDLAEKSVDQARKAFGEFVDVAQKAVSAVEQHSESARFSGTDVSRQALAYAEQNVEASLDFARRLVQARTVEEMTALQQEFFQTQAKAAADQVSGLTQTFATATGSKAKKS